VRGKKEKSFVWRLVEQLNKILSKEGGWNL